MPKKIPSPLAVPPPPKPAARLSLDDDGNDGGWGAFSTPTTKKKKQGKPAAAMSKEPPPPPPLSPPLVVQGMLKKTHGTLAVPRFPETRRMRAFDDSKGDAVQLIEVTEGIVQKALVTEDFVQNYITNDFRRKSERSRAVSGGSTKLFYSVQQSDSKRHLTPIPISRNLFDQIAPYARIPSSYIDLLSRPIAMHVFAEPQLPPTASPSRDEHITFILRSAAKGINGLTFGASFTYHIPTRHMYAFIHIYESPPYIDMPSALTASLRDPDATPFLIPLFLLHVDAEQRYRFITSAHSTLFSLEQQAGIRESRRGSAATDFSDLSKDLSYFLGNLSLVVWACGTMGRQLAFLEAVKGRYCARAAAQGVPAGEVESVGRAVDEGLESLGCLNRSVEEQAECLSERAQALIQTVYSGIAQRDAALSQKAAMAAARDSALMRIITAVTLFFLPATTVATFFSTTFFDFQVTRHERVYSWWLWLYWVVTVLLTAVIMAATFWWWRKKERELQLGMGIGERKVETKAERRVWRFRGLRRDMIENMSGSEE